jgi:hypothetical protein
VQEQANQTEIVETSARLGDRPLSVGGVDTAEAGDPTAARTNYLGESVVGRSEG